MKTIVLFGHHDAVQAAYLQLDLLLRQRQRQVRDIVLAQTPRVDQAQEHAIRDAGGELWYCGPNLKPPGGGWSPVHADRYLLSECWGALAGKVLTALNEFMAKTRVAT
jgi:hypothetical protein